MAETDNVKPIRTPGATERDELFTDPSAADTDFRFDQKTVRVFDDMVGRSVPYYAEMQRMTVEMAADFAVPGSRLYDLGCSTGTTLGLLDEAVDRGVNFVGVDNAPDMLAKAREKLAGSASGRNIQFVAADLHKDRVIDDASVVTMLLTLQFMRPLHRTDVVRNIYAGMRDQAALILVEKIIVDHSLFNRLFIKYYYNMKRRNGYSENEIAYKREALENVLIPYRPEENFALLRGAGFRYVEEFFRWYNFTGVIAVK
ncbi:MAG: carboxy-S-adenosyl-L-methionine synthase CmoA [Gammaproteobacteria bacterium]